jgi:hypothetical protein
MPATMLQDDLLHLVFRSYFHDYSAEDEALHRRLASLAGLELEFHADHLMVRTTDEELCHAVEEVLRTLTDDCGPGTPWDGGEIVNHGQQITLRRPQFDPENYSWE